MALNFPSDTSQPYVDPVSGLKYIYNPAIGAWESAIQPPCIIKSPDPPNIGIDGFLWWNENNEANESKLYILKNGVWTPVSTNDGDFEITIDISPTPPAFPDQGQLWWDPVSGQLYVWYIDINSAQWVEASPSAGGSGAATVFAGSSPPAYPVNGMLWFSTNTDILHVYDETLDIWVPTKAEVAGVNSLAATSPIRVDQSTGNVTISINQATETNPGAVQFANQAEVNDTSSTDKTLSPQTLKNGIDNYMIDATDTQRGVVKLATDDEAVNPSSDSVVITPSQMPDVIAAFGAATPPGTVITFAGAIAPVGYVECDGRSLSRTEYPELFTAIGTTYGTINASAFNVPDIRGYFVRGWNPSPNEPDANRAFGSKQEDSFESHIHGGGARNNTTTMGSDPGHLTFTVEDTSSTATEFKDTLPTGGSETRPYNIALLYCIKT